MSKTDTTYQFETNTGPATFDLKGLEVTCTRTRQPKRFHHVYLADLIRRKYDNNYDTFVNTYVSREGLAQHNRVKRNEQIVTKIDRLYKQIKLLKQERDTLNQKE